ncbi:thioredoxin family protein [Thiomicrorhabdus sediminis]|uniref:Thioredoxin family protein n=1 Tax=Thiomicrorhabdus sediminis TaxID=2580412 RepID=A0A4P9K4V2_9GAMM|nr:thioredoxin family protein [Thiomicrorhabdus sediminis]QCU89982.1 thioredoxin family protein [Thiomicrorhabdus sediminis]
MKDVHTLEELETLKYEQDALLVLYGGKECGVCHTIKPKLIELVSEHYPKIQMVYIDCHADTGICSQNSVFTLPVVQVFFGGQRFIEEVRSFSVQKLVDDIQRPYSMMFD